MPSLLTKVNDETLAHNLSRTSHALERRITIWKQIGRMGGMVAANAPAPAVDPQSFNKCLNEIDQLTSNSSEGHAWRKYMLIESLHDWAARRRKNDERVPRDLAQQVLKRFNQMSVTSHQRQFLTSGPMAALHQEMLRHTAEPVESNRLLQHLENYERSGLPSDARLLARDCQFLAVGSGAAQRELGERIETHYRNANLRIAVSAELLNRMIPKREPEYCAGARYHPGRAGSRPEPDGKRHYRAHDSRSAARPPGAGSQRRSGGPDPLDRWSRHLL